MGRPIKRIDNWGNVRCARCGEWKFIDQFYLKGGSYISFFIDGVETWFGKPAAYCIECTLDKAKSKRVETPLDHLNNEILLTKRRLALLEEDRKALLKELLDKN